MARRRSTKAATSLDPRTAVADGEVRGDDGRPVKRGTVVRRDAHFSPTLGVTVPLIAGVVEEIYTVASNPERVLVDMRDYETRGLYTAPAIEVRRSQRWRKQREADGLAAAREDA